MTDDLKPQSQPVDSATQTPVDSALLSFQKDQTEIVSSIRSLEIHSAQLKPAFELLDKQDPDTPLSSEQLQRLSKLHRAHWPMARASNRLEHSLATINDALAQIKNIAMDGQPSEYSKRLGSHQAEAIALVQLFANFSAELSSQPSLARQELLSMHYFDLAALCDEVKAIRVAYEQKSLPEELFAEWLRVEIDLLILKSALAQWRDNPAQDMAGQFELWADRLVGTRERLEKLRNNTLFECQLRGHRFGNRSGLITYTKIS
ncbi:MAG: hypothetical protein WC714_19675 [Candidatus Obscuribacterales bacterium]|jgi:hypothetical protein